MHYVLSKNTEEIVDKSEYKDTLKGVISKTFTLLKKCKLNPTEIQQKILINHLSELVDRAERGEKLESIDTSIFQKVSNNSLALAQIIVEYIEKNVGKVSDSEKYVLSIHFESMKDN